MERECATVIVQRDDRTRVEEKYFPSTSEEILEAASKSAYAELSSMHSEPSPIYKVVSSTKNSFDWATNEHGEKEISAYTLEFSLWLHDAEREVLHHFKAHKYTNVDNFRKQF